MEYHVVKVRYYGALARKTGTAVEQLEGESVNAVLKAIKKRYGSEAYKAAKASHILVNEENAGMYGGYSMKLQDGDEVIFFPVCGGG